MLEKKDLIATAAPIAGSLALVWVRAGKPIKPETAASIGLNAVMIASAVITAAEGATDNVQ